MDTHQTAWFRPSPAHVTYLVDMTLKSLQLYCNHARLFNTQNKNMPRRRKTPDNDDMDDMPTDDEITELETHVVSLMFEADPKILIHNIGEAASRCDWLIPIESTTGKEGHAAANLRLSTSNIIFCHCLAFTDMCCQIKGRSSIIQMQYPPAPQLASIARHIGSENQDSCHGLLQYPRLCHWINITVNDSFDGMLCMRDWDDCPGSLYGEEIVQFMLQDSDEIDNMSGRF